MQGEDRPETFQDHDSDSDDDHLFYNETEVESNIAYIKAESAKRENLVKEGHIGEIAGDSMKVGNMVREGHIGQIATDSTKVTQPAAHHKFSFHNFGFHPTPFSDLMSTIVTMRDSYNQNKTAYDATHKKTHLSKTGKPREKKATNYINIFDIKDFQKTQAKTHSNHKISRFREAPLKWDMSTHDERLLKELYRTAESDPSGRRIFDLARDEAKGATPWRPAEFDKDIAPPSLTALSPPFQQMLLHHMDSVVAQVEAEYERLPSKTQAQGEIKAGVGADLANLMRKRDLLRKDLQRAGPTDV